MDGDSSKVYLDSEGVMMDTSLEVPTPVDVYNDKKSSTIKDN